MLTKDINKLTVYGIMASAVIIVISLGSLFNLKTEKSSIHLFKQEMNAIDSNISFLKESSDQLMVFQCLNPGVNIKKTILYHEYVHANESLNLLKNKLEVEYLFSASVLPLSQIKSSIDDYQAKNNQLLNDVQKWSIGYSKYNDSYHILTDNIQGFQQQLHKKIKSISLKIKVFIAVIILTILALLTVLLIYFFANKKNIRKLSSSIKNNINNDNYKTPLDDAQLPIDLERVYQQIHHLMIKSHLKSELLKKRLQNALNNEKRYRELASIIPLSLFETNHLGNLTYINTHFEKELGYTDADIKEGVHLLEIMYSHDYTQLFTDNNEQISHCIIKRKNKTCFHAKVVVKEGTSTYNFKGKQGVIVSIKDVPLPPEKPTRQIKPNNQFAIDENIGLIANMSHEIRTPMNAIMGFAKLMENDQIEAEKKKEFLKYINTSSNNLLHLIDEIIDFAKIKTSQIKILNKTCNINALVDEVRDHFTGYRAKLQKDHIEFKIDIPKYPISISSDSHRIKQILTNLLSNAFKFTENGYVRLNVEIVKNSNYLRFTVEDTGIGIEKDDIHLIFDRFKRTKLSESKDIKGTGLGLAISKELTELLKGNMWVHSDVNKGTRFWFEIPYIKTSNNQLSFPITESNMEYKISEWKNANILVADDDETGYLFLEELLQSNNIKLSWAKDGLEAIETANLMHKNLDLIFMDIKMPKIDGIEATKEIKSLYPKIPIIAYTALAMNGDKEKCLVAGCDDYITKPLRSETLYQVLDKYLALPQSTPQKTEQKILLKEKK